MTLSGTPALGLGVLETEGSFNPFRQNEGSFALEIRTEGSGSHRRRNGVGGGSHGMGRAETERGVG